jgi:outer membrane protein OmpA-like peptidoglycan-associated protein
MKTKTFTSASLILVCLILSLKSKANTPPVKKITHIAAGYSVAELRKNLESDFSKSTIRIKYNDRLDQLAKLMTDKNITLALRGHADAIGTFKGNWVLSQKRADAVKDYLVNKGVDEKNCVNCIWQQYACCIQ